jgi:hypothetical protein
LLQLFNIVSLYFQAATLQRAVIGKGRNDQVTAILERAFQVFEIWGSVVRTGEEVENGTVVP